MYLFKLRLLSAVLAALLLGGLCLPALADGSDKRATILFTSDMHSHLLPAPSDDGGEFGGFARLATALGEARAQAVTADIPTLTVDGGDFSMGTLFQTIYTTRAPELRALGALGYDAVTLGNHEFEYRSQGLTQMLTAALDSGDPLPALVEANYLPPSQGQEGYDGEAEAAWTALNRYGVTDYIVLERGGVRFAIFGVMGENAGQVAPMSGMVLEPMVKAAQRVVREIQEKETYDFLICLSHGGTSQTGVSEDETLAKQVKGIDFIVSGHTHTTLSEPIIVGNTVIGSVGEFCNHLGSVTLSKSTDGTVAVENYTLIPIDERLVDDPEIAAQVEGLQAQVETEYLSAFQMTYDQVLARSNFDFTPSGQFAQRQEEDSLGNLVADGYRYAAEQLGGAPISAAFTNSGVIRGSLYSGDITVSDAFNISSLGSGADGTPGYPLVDAWLTGKELKNVMELDPSVGPIFEGAQLYSSGLSYKFNMHRLLFNRVTDAALRHGDGRTEPLEDKKLYRVVTNLYACQMLGLATEKSFGILEIVPKDERGQPVTDFESRILTLPDGGELKEWYALATYLGSFEQEGGVPRVPDQYAGPEGRKVRVESRNPVELLKQARWTTVVVLLLVLAVLGGIVGGVWFFNVRKSRLVYGKRRYGSRYRRYRG